MENADREPDGSTSRLLACGETFGTTRHEWKKRVARRMVYVSPSRLWVNATWRTGGTDAMEKYTCIRS